MRTHYVCHLANIIHIWWSRRLGLFGGGGGQLPVEMVITCCKRHKSVVTLRLQTHMVHYRWTSHSIANSISLLK